MTLHRFDLLAAKRERRPLTMVTCYDAWTARLLRETSVELVLVGDSAAMVMHGFDSTLHASVEMMSAHVAAVARGLGPDARPMLVGDLPFLTFRRGEGAALDASLALLRAGAQAVKLEGVRGHERAVSHLVESGIPVMGHLGLTPQSVHQLGGMKVQARAEDEARQLVVDARTLESLGAFAVVLECVPAELAAQVTAALAIPTIGIGAGPQCDGQVLVLQDLLGGNAGFSPKFLRRFRPAARDVGTLAEWIPGAVEAFAAAVRERSFPAPAETYA